MSASVYYERSVWMSQEKAFEAVKQAFLGKYACRVLREEPPHLLVIEQLPTPWRTRPHEVAKYMVFHFHPTGQNVTKVVAISLLHHELMKRIFYGYIGLGAIILFLYIVAISIVAYQAYNIFEDLLTTLITISPGAVSAGLIVAGVLDLEVYKLKDEIAKSVLDSLGRSGE